MARRLSRRLSTANADSLCSSACSAQDDRGVGAVGLFHLHWDWLPAAVAYVQDPYSFVLDGEQNPIQMRFVAVEKLTNFEREPRILGSDGTAFGKRGERGDRVVQSQKPADACFSGMLGKQPIQN